MLLPVPDGPVIKTGLVAFDNKFMIDEYRIVSIVSTIISWKLCSLLYKNGVNLSFQCLNEMSVGSKKKF